MIDRGKKHTKDRSAHYDQEKVVEVKSGVRSKISFFEQKNATTLSAACPEKELEVWEDEAGRYQILGKATYLLNELVERIDTQVRGTFSNNA